MKIIFLVLTILLFAFSAMAQEGWGDFLPPGVEPFNTYSQEWEDLKRLRDSANFPIAKSNFTIFAEFCDDNNLPRFIGSFEVYRSSEIYVYSIYKDSKNLLGPGTENLSIKQSGFNGWNISRTVYDDRKFQLASEGDIYVFVDSTHEYFPGNRMIEIEENGVVRTLPFHKISKHPDPTQGVTYFKAPTAVEKDYTLFIGDLETSYHLYIKYYDAEKEESLVGNMTLPAKQALVAKTRAYVIWMGAVATDSSRLIISRYTEGEAIDWELLRVRAIDIYPDFVPYGYDIPFDLLAAAKEFQLNLE
jgi:hypothetical protein